MRAIKTTNLAEFNEIALRIHNALKANLQGQTEENGFLRWAYPDYVGSTTGTILLIVEETGARGDIIMSVLTDAEKARIETIEQTDTEYFIY